MAGDRSLVTIDAYFSGPTFPDLVSVLYFIAAVGVLVYWKIGIWKSYNSREMHRR